MKSQDKNKVSIFSFLDSQARMNPNETAFVLLGKDMKLLIQLPIKNYIFKVAGLLHILIKMQKAISLYNCLISPSTE